MVQEGDVHDAMIVDSTGRDVLIQLSQESVPGGVKVLIRPQDRSDRVFEKGQRATVEVMHLVRVRDNGKHRITEIQVRLADWWYLSASFYDPNVHRESVLRGDLLTKFAPKLAKQCQESLRTNSLRNFYDVVKNIEVRINQHGTQEKKEQEFRQRMPQLQLLKAQIAHARGRNTIPQVFARFLNESVDICTDLNEFKGFLLVFEAVAGWHSYFSKS